MRLFKALSANGRSPYLDDPWPLPRRRDDGIWEPGEWVEKLARLHQDGADRDRSVVALEGAIRA